MSMMNSLGIGRPYLPRSAGSQPEYLLTQHPLKRVLAFTGRSIDDVINDPVAKREVLGYYKLSRHIWRRGEVVELEKQWGG
jgi:hypothetical protein